MFLKKKSLQFGKAKGNTCPYLNESGCSIYPVRPLTCRLYGTSVNYRCIMNVAPVRLLHEDEESEKGKDKKKEKKNGKNNKNKKDSK